MAKMILRMFLRSLAFVILGGVIFAATVPVIHWKTGDRSRPLPAKITPGALSTDDDASTVPSDAIVLFDGKSLSAWEQHNGKPAAWKVLDGYFEIAPGTGDLATRQAFGDCQLHLEWAAPSPTHGSDQEPGNSGVYMMSLYEIQILDSYENKTYADGQAGAVYCQYPPLVNASLPPGQWQSYDIIFRGPRFDADAKLLRTATLSLLHNGVLVQDHVELTGPTDYMKRPPYQQHSARMPLLLQDHGQPVRFRNIWIRELKEPEN
jgi:hypothetical protein